MITSFTACRIFYVMDIGFSYDIRAYLTLPDHKTYPYGSRQKNAATPRSIVGRSTLILFYHRGIRKKRQARLKTPSLSWESLTIVELQRVVRCFFSDLNIMRVALTKTSACNTNETCVIPQLIQVACSAIPHA